MIDNAIRTGIVKGVDAVSRRDWIKRILLYLHDNLGIAKARAVIRANHEASYIFSTAVFLKQMNIMLVLYFN
jgi:hypothetical protein